ncbi:tetrahydromethanopterin S-methyltransferase subunit A [Candidatus Bathyarchaeota archaeon]|nr:tetrahydromethanopterin S-methyltransferase subunit A [Candidatus Bathyarchaeota archaeon]
MAKVIVDSARCTGCGTCVRVCPEKVFEVKNIDGKNLSEVVAEANCFVCKACEIRCPEQAIKVTAPEILKVKPPEDYPPEEGRYLRGNDLSPVAVVAILDTFDFKIPPELTKLLQIAIESGAALAGTLQTENIGIEKLIANIVANPNIRYLVICWRESQGHLPADTLVNLLENGVKDDKRRTIIGARAPTPYLPNIPIESIERFRRQVTIVSLLSEDDPVRGTDPELVRRAVWSCIQEQPTDLLGYKLFDPGAWPEPPICRKIAMKVTEPWRPELDEKQKMIVEQALSAASRIGGKKIQEDAESSRKRKEGERRFLELLGVRPGKKDKSDK